MKTFNLTAHVTVSATTTVRAKTLEEAIELAGNRSVAIGGIHSGVDENDTWVIEEADGEPENIHEA